MCINHQAADTQQRGQTEIASLSLLLNTAMSEQSLSLRGFCKQCGMSPSTLSRIINNRQPPRMHHLQLFSEYLQIPFDDLLTASGIDAHFDKRHTNYDPVMVEMIDEILKSYDIEINLIVADVKKELKKYERYAKTAFARDSIRREFPEKLKHLHGEGLVINHLTKLYQLFCAQDTNDTVRAIAGSALLYLILTPDVIPDYAFPVGYLDDAMAILLVVNRLATEFYIYLT